MNLKLDCPVHRDFYVDAVAGRFGLDLKSRAETDITAEFPDLDAEKWTIGAIVGPSGSGKTSVARHLGADQFYASDAARWPADKAVVSCMGRHKSDDVFNAFVSVGFGSTPSWVKPYHVLSNGEKFRCDLARALLGERPRVWFDEFTSLVDRNVAKVGSAAVAKAVRRGKLPVKQFVAVTCHYDVLEWLEPDWIVDMATGTLARGSVRRPAIALEIVRCDRSAWRLFAKHHYLDTREIHHSSTCYMALWDGVPVSFLSVVHQQGFKDFKRVSRWVTLPDYQGVGIGTALLDGVAQLYREQGIRISVTSGHPALFYHVRRSAKWRLMQGGIKKLGNVAQSQLKSDGSERRTSGIRPVGAFEYVGG